MAAALKLNPAYYEPWPVYCIKFDRRASRMAISDWVESCVLFIGYMRGDKFRPLGTAFLVAHEQGGRGFLYLVTAQHVIVAIQAHSEEAALRMNTQDGALLGPIPLNTFHFHPDATEYIDVAVAPIGIQSDYQPTFINLKKAAATQERIKELAIGPGDEIFMVGHFRYHAGEARNLPIVRTGNIAGMPDEPIPSKAGPVSGYFIEARSLGGLSGSPVLVNMPPVRMRNHKAEYHKGLRHYLLGLLHGHYDENREELIHAAARLDGVNVGIAIVTPVERIIEALEGPELVEQRNKILEQLNSEDHPITEDSLASDEDAAGDELLERMLNTPPSPRES